MEEEYFTVDEVSKRFKVSRKAVYDWMRDGTLRYVIVGGRRRIPQSALLEFIRPGTPGEDIGLTEDSALGNKIADALLVV